MSVRPIKKICAAILCAAALLLSLTGCLIKTEPYELTSDGIVYVSYSCASVADGESFSFTIYEDEKSGGVKFSAWCCTGWDDIVITGADVTADDMDRLRSIAGEYGICDIMAVYKAPENVDYSDGRTVYDFRVKWESGEEHASDTAWSAADDVRDYFFDLAERIYREG